MKNPKTQFEVKAINKKDLFPLYNWCVKNLPLKPERSIKYWVNEVYIITSSQKIIDKLNEHIGSNFSFGIPFGNRVYYYDKE